MKRMQLLPLCFGLLAAFAWAEIGHAEQPETFTVLFSAEDVSAGVDVEAFFPSLPVCRGR